MTTQNQTQTSADVSAKKAMEHINSLQSREAIEAYIAGDEDRKSVLNARDTRIERVEKQKENTEDTESFYENEKGVDGDNSGSNNENDESHSQDLSEAQSESKEDDVTLEQGSKAPEKPETHITKTQAPQNHPANNKEPTRMTMVQNIAGFDLRFQKGTKQYVLRERAEVPLKAIPRWVITHPEFREARINKHISYYSFVPAHLKEKQE